MKFFNKNKYLFILLIPVFLITIWAGHFFITKTAVGEVQWEKFFPGNVLVGGKVRVVGQCIETMRISNLSASSITIDAPGASQVCTSLDAGVAETGGTEGYAEVGDDEDILLFSIQLPDTWLDVGAAGDLVIEFDLEEVGAVIVNIDVLIYQYGDLTPEVTDTIVIAADGNRAWMGLVTLNAGIGAVATLDPGDTLLISLTATADEDDFRAYGVRVSYRPGLEVTS